jgi:hypothetical protein
VIFTCVQGPIFETIFNTCPTLISTFTRDKMTEGFEVDKHLGHDKKEKIKTLEMKKN